MKPKQFLKNIWQHKVVLFACTIVILIVGSIVFRLLTPPAPVITQSIPQPKTNTIKETDFSGATITLPTNLPTFPNYLNVYTAQALPVSLTTLAKQLSMEATDQNNIWVDTNSSAYLIQDLYSKRISYSNATDGKNLQSISTAVIQINTAQTAAANYVQNQLGLSNLMPNINRAIFMNSGIEPEMVASATAQIVEIPFSYQVDGYNVSADIDIFEPVVVSVNAQNQVVSFSLSANLFTPIAVATKVKTLSLVNIPQQILAGNVSLLRTATDFPDGFTIKNIKSLAINTISLEYRFNSNINQILPYFRLHGISTNLQNHTSELDLITPAVVTTP